MSREEAVIKRPGERKSIADVSTKKLVRIEIGGTVSRDTWRPGGKKKQTERDHQSPGLVYW